LVPSIFGIGDAATPAVHSTVALGILSAGDDALLVNRLDFDSGHDLHAELREPPSHPTGQRLNKSRQDPVARVEQNNGTLRRINAAEVAPTPRCVLQIWALAPRW
jgi:hypothetical protein